MIFAFSLPVTLTFNL